LAYSPQLLSTGVEDMDIVSMLISSGLPKAVAKTVEKMIETHGEFKLKEIEAFLEAEKMRYNFGDKVLNGAMDVLQQSLDTERAHSDIYLKKNQREEDFIYGSNLSDKEKIEFIQKSREYNARDFENTQNATTSRFIGWTLLGGAVAAFFGINKFRK